ncbi:hypothetical protein AWV80_28490 [Cupriavidus sp. UYMU48A]|nr:hypothetical protein AWV80_28490 [Cupriavidus sp. UYMU48A]
MDLFTQQKTLDYVEAQAELLATHFSVVLGMQVTVDQAREALYAMHRPEGQRAKDISPEEVANAALKAVAPVIHAETLLRMAREKGATFGMAVKILGENRTPLERAYSDYACLYLAREGDLEFDKGCPVSISVEGGAYVQGWKYVSQDELPEYVST